MSTSSDLDSWRSPSRVVSSPPPATDSSSLRPSSANRYPSHSMHIMSPSDLVGPSPVTSNGTETTEIEDDATDEVKEASLADDAHEKRRSDALMLTTDLPDNVRQGSEEAVSVIHAPESFASWKSGANLQQHEFGRASPKADDSSLRADHLPYRPAISTNVQPVRYSLDSATPRAQDLQDMLSDSSRLRSSSTSSLEKIDEQTENEDNDLDDDFASQHTPSHLQAPEVVALKSAFDECWTLCNTFGNLSSFHRTRVFSSSGTPDAHERAWKTCWQLCQKLYASSTENNNSLNARLSIDMCRDFCQALFDVRHKKDEAADSVLRVSFELNNHLYSAQDSRNLPEEFRERTLDFYITLCHRLMKQRSDLTEETDQLLRACWTLAEMLFSLRENKRDRRLPDEELLSSAVQACWDLTEIFRRGWTQVQPDRSTPRPGHPSFSYSHHSERAESRTSNRSNRSSRYSKRDRESIKSTKSSHREEPPKPPPFVPETPVTEFEHTPVSPESRSPQMPNIMVLGTDSNRGGRWSSNASNLSSYSQSTHSSTRTSSTATTTAATEDPNLGRARMLVLRAAMNLGFDRDTITDPGSGSIILQRFVQALPSTAFGPSASNATLVQQYKNSVLTDAIIPRKQTLPANGKRATALEMAKSINAVSKLSTRYAYLRDLFRFVFQFPVEEVESRRNVSIVV